MSDSNTAQTKLNEIKNSALTKFANAQNTQDLYQLKVEYMGKQGALTEIMKDMAKLPKEEKPLFGKLIIFLISKTDNSWLSSLKIPRVKSCRR